MAPRTRYTGMMGWLGLVPGLAACAGEEALAPARRLAVDPGGTILGDLPTSHLVSVMGFSWRPTDGGVGVQVGLNEGMLMAAGTGEVDLQLVVQLTARNLAGQTRAISPKGDPVALLKVVYGTDAWRVVAVVVPWNGLDDQGVAMTGATELTYRVVLRHVLPTGDVFEQAVSTGMTTLVIE